MTEGSLLVLRVAYPLASSVELALQQLWERRHDGCLTHEAYQRIGGVTGSLATWCDTAVGQLPPAQRPAAESVLTALVRPADDTRQIPPPTGPPRDPARAGRRSWRRRSRQPARRSHR
jgi:hypothetical protein